MFVFSVIWNVLCIALCVAMTFVVKTTALDGVVFGVLLSAASWAIINILLAIFLRKKDAFSRSRKNWSTFYGFVASSAIVILSLSYIVAEEGAFPFWKIAIGIVAVFGGRVLLNYLYSKNRITRLLHKSIILDKNGEFPAFRYKRASILLPKVLDIFVPTTEYSPYVNKGEAIAWITVGEVTMKVEAPDNCVHLEYNENFAMQKIISGAILCTCVPVPSVSEGVCGADETVRGE